MSTRSVSLTDHEHYHAFLSHNSAEKPLVEQLGKDLQRRGVSCWLDKWNLIPGDPWQPAIEQALCQCDTCVVFFGPNGLGPWHNEEMRLAIQRRLDPRGQRLRILPVLLPGGERAKESDLPGFLQGTTWVEFCQSIDDEDALNRLECGIRGIPPGPVPGAAIVRGKCPYLGLKTFQPDDAPLFFGRAAKVQELIDRLRNNFGTPKEERFLALIGPSGSGKSSLALAGLIPAIRGGELPESQDWPQVRCRPGPRPWENLQLALYNNPQISSHIGALPALMTRPEDEQRRLHLTAGLTLQDKPETHRLFVLIDQFEEIFTVCNDEAARRQLIENLLYASSIAEGRTVVALTMRADLYGQCANYAGLRAAVSDHQSLIGPLSEEELREVIEIPAQLAGGEIEPGLMELLLADMKGQAGGLPFLEHALFKLWEIRDGRRLTAKAYRNMGRLEGALDAHAEEFFTKTLSAEEQSLCRQLLVDLVRPGEGSADTKKRVLLDDIASTQPARAALKKLADARLVTIDRDDQPEAARIELAHETLINGWSRLREWVKEHREKSRLKERLLDAAREWQRNGKREDFLYRGAQLAITEESFAPSTEFLASLGREFLDASLEFKSRLALQEEERKRRELDAALAAEKRIREVASQANVSLARYSHEAGNSAQALAHLAQALRLNQRNSGAAALTGAMLTQTSWPLPVTAPLQHNSVIYSAQFSPDGQRVVTASADKTARLWDVLSGKPIGEPMQHESAIRSAQFSSDGRRVVTASADKTARLWDALSGKPIGEPMRHEGAVRCAQFSPDGQRVVTASADRTARLWDVLNGKPIGEPMQHESVAISAQFSPDGQSVVTASADMTARLWDVLSGKPIGEPMRHEGAVISAQFSPDGQRTVTASADKTAQLWDALSGKAIGKPMRHEGPVISVQFSPDGQRIVTASADKTARLWDTLSGKSLGEAMRHGGAVRSAQFSPDGQHVVTASDDMTARIWMALIGKETGEPIKHGDKVRSAQFSPDGQFVVTASADKTAGLWVALSGKPIAEPMQHRGGVRSAQFSPDGQRVLTFSFKTAWLWDALSGKPIGEPMQHEGRVRSAQFSPDGQRAVTASDDMTARLWDTLSAQPIGEPMRHEGRVGSAQFSPDGQRIVTASSDTTARLWDALSGNPIGESMQHEGRVRSAQFSPDGQRVVTASDDMTARLWDALNGKSIGEPMQHEDRVRSAQFSPDGQHAVTASDDKTMQLWDGLSGKSIGKPMQHGGVVESAQFSPDGQHVVAVFDDKTAQLWNAVSGKAIGEPIQHEGQVISVQFSPDGLRVVTASADMTARLWDVLSGKPIGDLMQHEGAVRSAQFGPDGQRVVTASADKTARLWDALSGKPIGEPIRHGGAVRSAVFNPDGQRVVTASDDNTARLWDTPTIDRKDAAEDVLLLADLAEATGGVALETSGPAQILNLLTSQQVRASLEKIAFVFPTSSSKLTPLQQFLKWSVSQRRSRTISPYSKLTVKEWIENRIKEGTLESLRAAMHMDPANARLASHFGRRLADYALAKATDSARRARGEAEFQARRAANLASDNDEVKQLHAEVVKLLNLPSE